MPRLGAALLTALLLTACGSGAPGDDTRPGVPVLSGPVTITGNVTVGAPEQTLTSNLNAPAALRVTHAPPGAVTVTVEDTPPDLNVTVGTGVLDGTSTVVPLTARGPAPRGTEVTVRVTVGGHSRALRVPVVGFTAHTIDPAGVPGTYAASSILTGPGDRLTLVASPGAAAAAAEARHTLVHFWPGDQTFRRETVAAAQGLDTLISYAVTPDGTGWATVSASTARGTAVVNLRTGEALYTGVSDTPSRLSVTPDGALWLLVPGAGALLRLDPATGTFGRHAVDPGSGWLTAGQDGRLYLARSGAAPAIVQRDSAGGARAYPVTLVKESQPTHLTAAPDGTLWFIEATTSTVLRLNPATGTFTPVALPGDARPSQLTALPDGTLWVLDGRERALHRVQGGGRTATLPLPRNAAGQVQFPGALGFTAGSRVVFEAGGQLYVEQ